MSTEACLSVWMIHPRDPTTRQVPLARREELPREDPNSDLSHPTTISGDPIGSLALHVVARCMRLVGPERHTCSRLCSRDVIATEVAATRRCPTYFASDPGLLAARVRASQLTHARPLSGLFSSVFISVPL